MAFDIHRIDRIDPESKKAERQFEKYQNDLLGHFFDSPEGKKRLEADPGMGFWEYLKREFRLPQAGAVLNLLAKNE